MEPASTIIRKLGGPSRVAELVGVHRTRVHGWTRPKDKGGTGGAIPHWHIQKLMQEADKRDLGLEASDFIGAPEAAQ